MNSSRRLVYGILILTAISAVGGRILSTQLLFEPAFFRNVSDPNDRTKIWPATRPQPMPTFGSNDRSRWATIRNLVDEGSFVIGKRDRQTVVATSLLPLGQLDPLQAALAARGGLEIRTKKIDSGTIFRDGWQSIDKVLHPSKLEYYSSKPPLLSTIVAGLYWLLKLLLGWTLDSNPWAVVRTVLIIVNLVPFAIYLAFIARLAERYGTTDWGRYFVLAAAGFGTLVTPFQLTLNNHTVGTYCVLFALVCVLHIWSQAKEAPYRKPRWQSFAAAGLFASFAVCNELPALAFAGALFAVLLLYFPRRALLFFSPAALAPVLAFFAVNYVAVGQLRPAYSEFGGPWYEYEGSHWRRPNEGEIRPGIDFARYKESRLAYAFHVLAGHHGWFSLTPIWLLALFGMIASRGADIPVCRSGMADTNVCPTKLPWFLAPMVLAVSSVVIGFYLLRSDNYGGWTLGPRWLMWLTPLWLLFVLPAVDRLSTSRWGRGFAYVCLAVSIASAHYSPWNPWRHPWLYDLMMAWGWPGY